MRYETMPRLMSYVSSGCGDTALITFGGSDVKTDADCLNENGATAITGLCLGAGGSVSPGSRYGFMPAR